MQTAWEKAGDVGARSEKWVGKIVCREDAGGDGVA